MKYALHDLPLSNSFSTLGEDYYSRVLPTPFASKARLLHFNNQAANLLDLDRKVASDPSLPDFFTGKRLFTGADPIAMLYAGHQFGHFVPQLGDGRAIILGETTNQRGQRWEIQLKGSGLTPYSRDGDGRAVLRSSIREYLCSEAVHALGIPSTRALCLIGSDDEVYREQIEPGAMLTRLAPSHVRFGSFEVFYYRDQFQHIRTLADYVIATQYPELDSLHQGNSIGLYSAWLSNVIERTATLIAQWQAIGFCHGVMNSDNMSVLGLTIDYGPFAFMEAYDPDFICNHSDHHGRYAYKQQPDIGLFNLSCFAQSILPLLGDNVDDAVKTAKDRLAEYETAYLQKYAALMRSKLGFMQEYPEDEMLIKDLQRLMAQDRVDYTILFRRLCDFNSNEHQKNDNIRDLFIQREHFDSWARRYSARLQRETSEDRQRSQSMKQVNPKYVLRNYMAETAIRKAQDDADYSEIDRLHQLLQSPFDESPEYEHYAGFPPDWAGKLSVSCSS